MSRSHKQDDADCKRNVIGRGGVVPAVRGLGWGFRARIGLRAQALAGAILSCPSSAAALLRSSPWSVAVSTHCRRWQKKRCGEPCAFPTLSSRTA